MFFNQNFDNNKRDGIFLIKLVKTIIHLRFTNYKTLKCTNFNHKMFWNTNRARRAK